MKLIRTYGKSENEAQRMLQRIESRSGTATSRLEPAVRQIIGVVRRRGDAGVRVYAERWDTLDVGSPIRVTRAEMAAAWEQTPADTRKAMRVAMSQIHRFAKMQMPKNWIRSSQGVRVGQRCWPLESVGCYVPGGRYPLPSTLLMTVVPAQVAGVARIAVVSPRPAKETLAAAHLTGVKEFHRIGGAHSIAALAYGTATIPRVDKIVGPGNLYVTTAKKLVSFDCGIDMLAGPTEIVIASESGNPQWIAADLVAQAEHDPAALAILVTTNENLAKTTLAETKIQSCRNAVATKALAENSFIFLAKDREEVAAITNRIAPEHLTVDTERDLSWVRHAGSVFIGSRTPQSMGDYISGPNHVLPTGTYARIRGGLSVLDFVRIVAIQKYSAEGLARLGPSAAELAAAEGLVAHAASIRIRMESTSASYGGDE